MAGPIRFRKDLFKGTADYYDRFRPGYPDPLLDEVRSRVPGRGRLLDLACATGQIAFALAADFGEVDAVDQEPEFLEFGRRKAARLGVANITWIESAAESLAVDGPFDLIAIGNAFHRFDREAVARQLVPLLAREGYVALLWGDGPWDGAQDWQVGLRAAIAGWDERHAGNERVPARWREAIEEDPHDAVLRRAGLLYEGRFQCAIEQRWTIDELIGFLFSTSAHSRDALRDEADAFEADIRASLESLATQGFFEGELSFACELARRPA